MAAYGWPDMSGAPIGATFQMLPIATEAVSGSSFTFSVPISNGNNYLFSLSDGTHFSTVFATGSANAYANVPSQNVSSLTQTILNAKTTLIGNHAPIMLPVFSTPSIQTGLSQGNSSSESSTQAKALHASPHLIISGCSASVLSNSPRTWTPVGQVHTTTGTSAVFSYNVNTSSAISVGFSLTDAVGSFSVDGSISVSAGGSAPLSVGPGVHQQVETQFIYTHYKLTCPEVRGSYTAYAVAASNWSGGMQLGQSVTTNPNGGCNYLHDVKLAPFGGSASIWNGSTITYDVGFSLFGFSFSNLVSNDMTSVVTSWTNNGSVTTYLCGPDNTASPLGQAITYNSTVG